jgi:MmyB-like transcription regulator ligand binding domain
MQPIQGAAVEAPGDRLVIADAADPAVLVGRGGGEAGRVAHVRGPAGRGVCGGGERVQVEKFRRLWATHDAKEKGHGVKRLRHPLVGDLTLSCERFSLVGDEEQALITYHPEPGPPSADALRLLASWGTDATHTRTGTSAPSV